MFSKFTQHIHIAILVHCAQNEMALPCYYFHNQAKTTREYSEVHMQLHDTLKWMNLIISTQ